jgi:hypothetical protein
MDAEPNSGTAEISALLLDGSRNQAAFELANSIDITKAL